MADAGHRESWPAPSTGWPTFCRTCSGRVEWVDCPTGGWWAHRVHPADEHDATPS